MSESIELDNLDYIEDLFNFIKKEDTTLDDVLKKCGGINYYIPSYKTTIRNDKIIAEYRKRYGEMKLAKKLARKYELSEQQIFAITKEVRESPSLF